MQQPIVIGLGSNLGNRWEWIRHALMRMEHNGLSIKRQASLYENKALLSPNAPSEWDKPYLNTAVLIETSLSPADCLRRLKTIEQVLGRDSQHLTWAPRTIDLDILVWGDVCIDTTELTIPHPGLQHRIFALLPLLELCPEWVCPVSKTSVLALADASLNSNKALLHRVFAPHTQLVGIANITPDSFSDGGSYIVPDMACQHIESLIDSGATVIDIGAQSTRPRAVVCGPKAEWERLQPVLTTLASLPKRQSVHWSIDTYHTAVAKQAIESFNVDWINDVSGGADAGLIDLLVATGKRGVFMHALTVPVDPEQHLPYSEAVIDTLYQWGTNKIRQLVAAGMREEQIILDPGIGFGKTVGQSLQLIKQIARLRALGVQILVGHSRKSFMQAFTQVYASERDVETLGISGALHRAKVDYIRVHAVDWHSRYLAAQYAAEGPW
ncbi:MAG: 2-amino-4-hydroxy-6-hydroxymethyldihydropteridine pyrophosphokinae [Pseudomonadota bacterium]|jgi:2-amino-4-hydroxy-6-hydroxymethyldihydropteridine diphosphokinase/dihydropteroate synthase